MREGIRIRGTEWGIRREEVVKKRLKQYWNRGIKEYGEGEMGRWDYLLFNPGGDISKPPLLVMGKEFRNHSTWISASGTLGFVGSQVSSSRSPSVTVVGLESLGGSVGAVVE